MGKERSSATQARDLAPRGSFAACGPRKEDKLKPDPEKAKATVVLQKCERRRRANSGCSACLGRSARRSTTHTFAGKSLTFLLDSEHVLLTCRNLTQNLDSWSCQGAGVGKCEFHTEAFMLESDDNFG